MDNNTISKLSDKGFREITSLIGVTTWEWNIAEDKVVGNELFYDMYGFNNNEPIMHQLNNNIHPEFKEFVNNNLYNHFKDENSLYSVEFKYTNPKTKKSIWISSNGKVITRNKNNEPLLMIGISIDISDRIEIENKLAYFQRAFNSSSEAIAMALPDGTHLYQNPAFTKLFGYSIDELKEIGPHKVFFYPEIADELFSNIMAGKPWYGETPYRTKDGKIINVEIKSDAIKDDEGEVIGLIGFHSDISKRIDKENDIKLQYEKSFRIFDAIDEVVYVSDPITYELLYVNQKVINDIGAGNNLKGQKCYKALQGKDEPCDFCTNDIILNNKNDEAYIWEFQNLVNKRWYRCADKTIDWIDGRKVRMEMAVDITAEKTARIKLKESEELYKLVSAASNNGIWDWKTYSDEVFYSDLWKAQVGYEPYELENTFDTWTNLLHPECKDRTQKSLEKFLANPKEYYIEEFRLRHKNGSYRWIMNKAAAVIEDGKVIRMFGAHTDITDRKLAEDTIRAQDKLYRDLIENAPDGVVMIGSNSKFKFASTSAIKMFGYEIDELININPDILTHPDDLPMVIETLNKVVKNEVISTPTISYRFKTKSNDWKWIESTFSLHIEDDGLPNIVINFRDISERKTFEDKLIKERKKAESANIHKNQFLANMSHEIRTPMNGVIGFAELLKDDNLNEKEKIKYIEIIDNNSKQLLGLIDDIIDVAKIEAGELSMITRSCNISVLLQDVQILMNQLKTQKFKDNINFELILPASTNDLIIRTDELRLRQIITNLLNNSLKFTDEGIISFGFRILGSNLEFFVKDQGIGIPQEEIEEIFGRFKQATNNESAIHGGTGLGLAICKGIVELMGGNITVKSEFNKGSEFSFRIPFVKTNNRIKRQQLTSDIDLNSLLKGKTILIAEDDFVNQEYFKALFNPFDVKVLIAHDGKEAVELFLNNPQIDLTFMDIRMPIMDGYTAIKEILSTNKDAVIIAQTAYAMPDERNKCLNIGCKAYIVKPIIRVTLFNLLKIWMK